MIRERYENLLGQWCDGLLEYQIKDSTNRRFRGGLMCPACQRIHGRSADAVYPLLYMAHKTGQKKYLEGAVELFKWGENVICDDGSSYNDAQKEWSGITVFAALLALTGNSWKRPDYLKHAGILAESCRRHITRDGLFYGEGKPMEYVTPRGCRPSEMGYNAEESVPALLTYARVVNDREGMRLVGQ